MPVLVVLEDRLIFSTNAEEIFAELLRNPEDIALFNEMLRQAYLLPLPAEDSEGYTRTLDTRAHLTSCPSLDKKIS